MNIRLIKSLLLTVLCGFWAFSVNAATPMFSDYGQIQNVQFYSTNPFWTPTSPYNKRMPQAVYVQGADLNTEDCLNVVQSLVYVQCVTRDNCRDTSLSDIRPTIMVQLSKLPGNNYVSACAGYIDGAFDAFVKQYGNTVPNKQVNFPTVTFPNPDVQNINTYPKIAPPTQTQQNVPDWQSAINERTQELIELQKQNGADSYNLSATDFPATIADLSFTARNELKTDGYKPFMHKSAYTTPIIKNQKEWCAENPDYPGCPKKETKKSKSNDKSTTPKARNNAEEAADEDDDGDNGDGGGENNDDNNGEADDDEPCTVPHATKTYRTPTGECDALECEDGWKLVSFDHGGCEPIIGTERYAILFMNQDAYKNIGDIIEPNDESLQGWYYDSDCSDHHLLAIDNENDINKNAQSVFTNYSGGDFYLDIPYGVGTGYNTTSIFPGLLHVAKGAGSGMTWPKEYGARNANFIIISNDKDVILQKMLTLKRYLQGGRCAGLQMYVVALDVDDSDNITTSPFGASFNDNAYYDNSSITQSKIKKVKIMSKSAVID